MNIECNNVSFAYTGDNVVLKDLSFRVEAGEFFLIVGQNGAGKSTLLKLLNGILKPSVGAILVSGQDTRITSTATLAQHLAVTFQNPGDQIFASTVRDEVAFAPTNLKRTSIDSLVQQALELCNLHLMAAHHPYDLPPAEKKLLTVASAIAADTPFLAFDEPSAGLSQIERSLLERIITTLRKQGRAFLVVSHDLELFFPYATRVVVLNGGRFMFEGTPEELIAHEGVLRKAGLRLPAVLRAQRILRTTA